MAPDLERHVDALLKPLSRTIYLATGTVLAVLRDGAWAVELDGARATVIVHPVTDAPIGAGAHVLVEPGAGPLARAHGTVPADLVLAVRAD